ncbi:type I glyceraldehyde-3-phosphate dehydrogenase [Fangia hongkongensis]|uniref:type I glyceraldehyde-3-phosphate dehydrogenase n=1 Tax=Fangia hongkongensis TaxID=270495 RepID=UPI00037D4A00|nr:type I glyceraldehyde-3-phosphate dehydrogenase [Fangia hongkongensis]MBK2124269.1 type I glyceraldehyde-3-phosphate dehydrogenase [Fangia hongkongensis]
MAIKIAINGYGRIGRCVLRAIYEGGLSDQFKIVAINDLGSADVNVHLTKYDTTHGRFPAEVSFEGSEMLVNGDRIQILAERNPEDLPWGKLDVDVVFECTGIFTSKEKCQAHLKAGAKKVVISAPGGKDVDATIVYGVNDNTLRSDMTVISNASCTTNCLAPVAKALNDTIGIKEGLMTTIHAYTNDQSTVDSYHKDLHRARAAAQNMIPTKTGAAAAVGLVLPELKGRLDGFAMRVPVINVSVVDLTFNASAETSVEEVNSILKSASEGKLNGVLGYNTAPLVSSDFNHDAHPSIFDATQTRVIGSMVKVLSWYDNEWGFSNQMLRTTKAWFEAK